MMSMFDKQYVLPIVAAVALSTAVPTAAASSQIAASATTASEFPAETAAIVAATSALFDAVEDRPRPDSKRQVITGPIVATPASIRTAAGQAGVLTANGPVDHLTGYRITWYPVDRFLGTVDFMGTWNGNRNLVCGFVTWDLSDPDAPVLEDVSATFVDVPVLARQDDEEIHAALLDANCAYGAVEANYAFFD